MANNFVKKVTHNAKCIEINRYISYTYKNVCLIVPNKFHSGQVIDISYIVDQFTTDYTLSAISLIDPDDVKKMLYIHVSRGYASSISCDGVEHGGIHIQIRNHLSTLSISSQKEDIKVKRSRYFNSYFNSNSTLLIYLSATGKLQEISRLMAIEERAFNRKFVYMKEYEYSISAEISKQIGTQFLYFYSTKKTNPFINVIKFDKDKLDKENKEFKKKMKEMKW